MENIEEIKQAEAHLHKAEAALQNAQRDERRHRRRADGDARY